VKTASARPDFEVRLRTGSPARGNRVGALRQSRSCQGYLGIVISWWVGAFTGPVRAEEVLVMKLHRNHVSPSLLAGALAIAFGLVLPNVSAQARNVARCEGPQRQSVVNCCEAIVRAEGLPFWMESNYLTCRLVVSCAPRHGKSYCRVHTRPPNFCYQLLGPC
jgi:hypothetical protein